MKRVFYLLLVLALGACGTQQLDEEKAKARVAQLLELMKTMQYDKMDDYYSDEYDEYESAAAREKKFEEIEGISGPIVSYEFVSSKKEVVDDRKMVWVEYSVKCKNLTLKESFLVAIEEGEYKVVRQSIENK